MWRLESMSLPPSATSSRISTESRRRVGKRDLHALFARRRDVLAHVVGADRQLSVSAVDQDRELDRARPPVVHDRVHRGADGAPGEQHVVDEHDVLPSTSKGMSVRCTSGREPGGDVVAVEGDVERADGHLRALDALDALGQRLGDHRTPRHDPHERDLRAAPAVGLEDLVRDAGQLCPVDRRVPPSMTTALVRYAMSDAPPCR
jgi:hypothetical protein